MYIEHYLDFNINLLIDILSKYWIFNISKQTLLIEATKVEYYDD